ncbi:hypothetical protein FRC07_008757, partial [Ceratobasidium sp. 392]
QPTTPPSKSATESVLNISSSDDDMPHSTLEAEEQTKKRLRRPILLKEEVIVIESSEDEARNNATSCKSIVSAKRSRPVTTSDVADHSDCSSVTEQIGRGRKRDHSHKETTSKDFKAVFGRSLSKRLRHSMQKAPKSQGSDIGSADESDVEILDDTASHDAIWPAMLDPSLSLAPGYRAPVLQNEQASSKVTLYSTVVHPSHIDHQKRVDVQREHNLRSSNLGLSKQTKKLHQFIEQALSDYKPMASVQAALKVLQLKDAAERLPGMRVTLMPHQLTGAAWMVQQELSSVKGGILADDMGLGKTVQTIALIVRNQPGNCHHRKSTLIVVPAALIYQWYGEITERTAGTKLRVRIHHAQHKLKDVEDVGKYDIILTTFHTLTNEFPDDDENQLGQTEQEKLKDTIRGQPVTSRFDDETTSARDRERPKNRGPLAATQWYRVVLDEAQNIRNRATRSSWAVSQLDATYRWALTGTPVINAL